MSWWFPVLAYGVSSGSTGEFRANLFREVMGQMPAVGRRTMHVVEVHVERHGDLDRALQFLCGGHAIKAELNRAHRGGGYRQQEIAAFAASCADQQHFRAPEVCER